MRLPCSLLVLLFPLLLTAQTAPHAGAPAAPAPSNPEDRCRLEGQVVNSLTGEPLARATVVATRFDVPPGAGVAAVNSGTVTDAEGKFAMKDLEPGQYRVRASHTGFVAMWYGARTATGIGAMLAPGRGQKLEGLVFRLDPQAVVTGRIVDADGDPQPFVSVLLNRFTYQNGKRQMTTAGSTTTNDLGEYRIFALAPGRYYMSALYRQVPGGNVIDRSAVPRQAEDYLPTFYPGTADASAAKPIDVAAGSHLTGIDMKLIRTPTYSVAGHVTQTAVPGRGGAMSVMVLLQSDDEAARQQAARTGVVDVKGNFELHGVAPGTYDLRAAMLLDGKRYVSRSQLVVTGPMDSVALQIGPGVQVNGVVRMAGGGAPPLNALHVQVRQHDVGGTAMLLAATFPKKGEPVFVIENLGTDLWDMAVTGLPDGYYLQSIRAGKVDVMNGVLDTTDGKAPEPIEIVLSAKAAQVAGLVKSDDAKRLPASATVVLVPQEAERTGRARYYLSVAADAAGKFTFRNVTPGEYRVYAWDEVEAGSWLDADYMKPLGEQGAPVTVHESGKESVEVKLVAGR